MEEVEGYEVRHFCEWSPEPEEYEELPQKKVKYKTIIQEEDMLE